MDAKAARQVLVRQHDRIRVHLGTCTVLACRFREGESVLAELDEALDELRTDFMEHNVTETSLVGPLLHGSPDWGAVLIDRMLEEHVAEHAAFWELLAGSAVDVVYRIDDLVDELDAHMAAEERTFLRPMVLHPDAIARHAP
jgi:iron-sulfur cluster repair protein YtfE (RIC family)